jgi:hypothetical protein
MHMNHNAVRRSVNPVDTVDIVENMKGKIPGKPRDVQQTILRIG